MASAALLLLAGAALACANTTPTRGPLPVEERVEITEYGDFQCPHCQRFATELKPQLESDYVDPGLATFTYRHLPFLGQASLNMALASECARNQGHFDAYHDLLYSQPPPASGWTKTNLAEAGTTVGADKETLGQCLAQGETMPRIQADVAQARKLGVQGTPTLYVNGQEVAAPTYRDLQRAVERALADSAR